jgi:Fe-Mn family superoxide dismutase
MPDSTEQKKQVTRRDFIRNGSGTLASLAIAGSAAGSLLSSCSSSKAAQAPKQYKTGFEQTPLLYTYDGLEQYIDAATMDIHYNKHAAAYAKNLKEAATAEGIDMTQPLEKVLAVISSYSAKVRNNGGGHFNHELFWKIMRPLKTGSRTQPAGKLADAINRDFGSFDQFKTQFNDAAKSRFGSGWAWLYIDANKKLKTGSTPNQDNPLMNISEIKGLPLLGLDVWEHAYYLKYQNKRADYINNWWNLVHWEFVENLFEQA